MDAIELARQLASDLHQRGVAEGCDPWDPYAFAVAAAQRHGIVVEPCAAGAAMLHGGRATYIADDRLILHEDVGTTFERAFLVAHEIGHATLGDDSGDDSGAEPARTIDPARPAEPTPVGVDRVVDYGRRQRREVQMDLFAREFLLPRSAVRRLHLEEGMTASQIADRLGAGFDVVAQQLLDALLLPAIDRMPEDSKERPLNPLQADAAGHRGAPFLLEAGPGTGKTQTLVARLAGLLDDGVDPRRILLLTFSNKAAGEMAERIAVKHPAAAAAMWIGTFHAFGLDLIRRFHGELGLSGDPRMMDRTEAVELLEREFPRLDLLHYRDLYDPTTIIAEVLSAISRAKDEVVDERRYAELAEAMHRNAVTSAEELDAERALEVARVYQAYEALKRQSNRVDFGDLVALPVRLLEDNPDVRSLLRDQYDHVLVDEYQDVNRSSVRLLQALCGTGENLWVVGDAKQSIYRFRGASSFNTARFGKQDFPAGERGRLKQNYRSVREIVDLFSAFAVQMQAGDADSMLDADRAACGEQPELRTVTGAGEQPVAIADTIEEMRGAGFAYRDQAILCTGNERLASLGAELERLGVPVLFLGSLFERPEVRDLFALLSILTDRRAAGLVRLACRPEFTMPFGDVASILERLSDDSTQPCAWLREPGFLADLGAQSRAAVEQLAATLDGFDSQAKPWHVLAATLLDRTRIAAGIGQSVDPADRTRGIAIWQVMNFVRSQPVDDGPPVQRLLERVRRLLRLGDDRDLRQLPLAAQGIDAVRLMTVHGAKGLEFPVVHVPGLNAGTIPRSPSPPRCPPPDGMVEGAEGSGVEVFRESHLEEQECLFYVALSRARDRLFLYAPTQKSNGARWPLSPFIGRLGTGLQAVPVEPARVLPDAPDTAVVLFDVDGDLRFSAHQVSLYGSCARRFFYTHILRIGGRRRATPYMQMHDAVRGVVEDIIAELAPDVAMADLGARIDAAFARHGLADDGYVGHYKAFASSMLGYLATIRSGHTAEAPQELSLTYGAGAITVRPDDVLLRPDGGRTLRRISTGHRRSAEDKDAAASAFVLAARAAHPDARVELVHLADQTVHPLPLAGRALSSAPGKLAGLLEQIRHGRFPASPSSRTCPGCPAFFICGPTPEGRLKKNF